MRHLLVERGVVHNWTRHAGSKYWSGVWQLLSKHCELTRTSAPPRLTLARSRLYSLSRLFQGPLERRAFSLSLSLSLFSLSLECVSFLAGAPRRRASCWSGSCFRARPRSGSRWRASPSATTAPRTASTSRSARPRQPSTSGSSRATAPGTCAATDRPSSRTAAPRPFGKRSRNSPSTTPPCADWNPSFVSSLSLSPRRRHFLHMEFTPALARRATLRCARCLRIRTLSGRRALRSALGISHHPALITGKGPPTALTLHIPSRHNPPPPLFNITHIAQTSSLLLALRLGRRLPGWASSAL